MELVCSGGWVVERSEEEEDMDIDNESSREGRVMMHRPRMCKKTDDKEGGSTVDAIRIEFPIPEGLHCSFMLRFLETRVINGRERALADLEKDRAEREARKNAKRKSWLRQISTRVMSTRFLRK